MQLSKIDRVVFLM